MLVAMSDMPLLYEKVFIPPVDDDGPLSHTLGKLDHCWDFRDARLPRPYNAMQSLKQLVLSYDRQDFPVITFFTFMPALSRWKKKWCGRQLTPAQTIMSGVITVSLIKNDQKLVRKCAAALESMVVLGPGLRFHLDPSL